MKRNSNNKGAENTNQPPQMEKKYSEKRSDNNNNNRDRKTSGSDKKPEKFEFVKKISSEAVQNPTIQGNFHKNKYFL